MKAAWIVGSIAGVTAGCFDGLTLEPVEDEPLIAASQPASMDAIYDAFRLENLRTDSGATSFTAGSDIYFDFDLVSYSRKPLEIPFNDVYGLYVVGAEQSWILRLGPDPTLDVPPGTQRKGDWYAFGGEVLDVTAALDKHHRIRYGNRIPRNLAITGSSLPAGSYRYFVEYKRLGSGIYDGVLQTAQVDFTVQDTPNYVFVTSTTYSGNLGGLAGADAACQGRAAAGGLGGTYRAYLSTDTINAIDRLGTARGWRRPDNQLVADSPAALAQEMMFHPIRIDELGNDVGTLPVLTATWFNGTRQPNSNTCSNWTSTSTAGYVSGGISSGDAGPFSSEFFATCDRSDYHLYCFAIDKTVPVAPTPVPGRIVFLSNAPWTPGAGLAAADAVCQSDAQNAGFAGTFRAALAVSGTTVASRFDTSGATWVRPDGVAVAPTAAAFFTAQFYDSDPAVTASGTHLGNWGSWTGASNLTTSGTDATTCSSWTAGAAANSAIAGRAGFTETSQRYGMDPATPCDATYIHLTCMQL